MAAGRYRIQRRSAQSLLGSAGIVFTNNFNRNLLGTPFGGTKASGFGREHCIETLYEFGYRKAVRSPSGLGEIPRWFAVDKVLRKD